MRLFFILLALLNALVLSILLGFTPTGWLLDPIPTEKTVQAGPEMGDLQWMSTVNNGPYQEEFKAQESKTQKSVTVVAGSSVDSETKAEGSSAINGLAKEEAASANLNPDLKKEEAHTTATSAVPSPEEQKRAFAQHEQELYRSLQCLAWRGVMPEDQKRLEPVLSKIAPVLSDVTKKEPKLSSTMIFGPWPEHFKEKLIDLEKKMEGSIMSPCSEAERRQLQSEKRKQATE